MSIFSASSTRRERRWVISIIIAAILLSSLPYIFGAIRAGSHATYLWTNPLGQADTNVYFSMIKQASQGKVFLENLYTSEPQHGSLFQPLWLLLGWVAGLTHIAIPILFHLVRMALVALFLLLLYRLFVRQLFHEERQRILAMLLLAFSSGIGTFFSFSVNTGDNLQTLLLLPADQWIPEANTFLTLVHSPLFIIAQLLLVGILWSFLTIQRGTVRLFVALVGLLAIVHPYDIVTIAVILPVFIIIRTIRDTNFNTRDRWMAMRALIIAGCAAFLALLAFVVAGLREPAIGMWTRQNITTSPLPHSYILGYGLVVPFAVIGWMAWRKTRGAFQLLILTWAITSIFLLYVPVQINRRFSNGLHIPLTILATAGIDVCWAWLSSVLQHHRWTRQIILAAAGWTIGLGLFLSTSITVARAMYWEANPASSIYHVRRDEAQAIRWLEKETPMNAVILAHPFIGNIIPAMTGRRVYVGHGHQTIRWKEKIDRLFSWFWKTNTDDAAKHQFLTTNRITYVLFGPYEDPIGDYDPAQKTYLVPVHTEGQVTVYRVVP